MLLAPTTGARETPANAPAKFGAIIMRPAKRRSGKPAAATAMVVATKKPTNPGAPAGFRKKNQRKKTTQSTLSFLGKKCGAALLSRKARADAQLQMAMAGAGLNPAQRAVVTTIMNGHNVFLTGCAGSGKSHTLAVAIGALKDRYGSSVFVTAPSGCAATRIGGTTLHSFAGIGLAHGSQGEIVDKVLKSRWSVKRWQQCKVLVVDEISMLSGKLFDTLECIARACCNSRLPFGGIQLVVCGDFFQLPPVEARKLAFQSRAWGQAFQKTFNLTRSYRCADEALCALLNSIRAGNVDTAVRKMLVSRNIHRIGPPPSGPDDEPIVKLVGLKSDAESHNKMMLAQLRDQEMVFEADDTGINGTFVARLSKNVQAPRRLHLKRGAHVVLVTNLDVDGGLVNGATGVVQRFESDLEDSLSPDNIYPVVKFSLPEYAPSPEGHGMVMRLRSEEVLVKAHKFSVMQGDEELAAREQIPLNLAWAITIHKAQGMSLARCIIRLTEAFCTDGQAYVALSRVKSLDGLWIDTLPATKITADPRVKAFYQKLEAEAVAETDEPFAPAAADTNDRHGPAAAGAAAAGSTPLRPTVAEVSRTHQCPKAQVRADELDLVAASGSDGLAGIGSDGDCAGGLPLAQPAAFVFAPSLSMRSAEWRGARRPVGDLLKSATARVLNLSGLVSDSGSGRGSGGGSGGGGHSRHSASSSSSSSTSWRSPNSTRAQGAATLSKRSGSGVGGPKDAYREARERRSKAANDPAVAARVKRARREEQQARRTALAQAHISSKDIHRQLAPKAKNNRQKAQTYFC